MGEDVKRNQEIQFFSEYLRNTILLHFHYGDVVGDFPARRYHVDGHCVRRFVVVPEEKHRRVRECDRETVFRYLPVIERNLRVVFKQADQHAAVWRGLAFAMKFWLFAVYWGTLLHLVVATSESQ
ncbi:MAG: hypothetical protein IJS96_03095 [Schwartzia sp.]|nr:hypothetical protein [Schwartzia sp. (in: firmicutes)]